MSNQATATSAPALDPRRAHLATKNDRKVIAHSHRLGYALLHTVAKLGHIVKVPGIGVIVSEAGAMRAILVDNEHFSKVGPGASSELWTPIIGDSGLVNMDGPKHIHLRQKLGPMFTNRFVSKLIGDIVPPQLAAIKARLIAGEAVDIAIEVERTAANMVCRLAGYDMVATDPDVISAQLANARAILGAVKITTRQFTPEQAAEGRRRLADIHENIRKTYQLGVEGSVANLLKEAEISEDDTVSVISALIVAGTETMVSHITRFTQIMVTSGYFDVLAANPSKVSDCIDEGFRVTVPSAVMVRAVRKPTRLGRFKVEPGVRIVLATHESCQRAGDFNPERPVPKEMRQLWFGAGAHFCLGMPMAQMMVELYLEMFAEAHRQAPIRIVSKKLRTNSFVSGYDSLVISCTY
jgi:cytochrome P450